MAKSKKDKAAKKSLSMGNLYSQEAVSGVLSHLTRLPDQDEVLRKAGVSRHRLKVLLDDDEIGQAAETRKDALLSTPFRIEPSDTPEAELLKQELDEWFFEVATAAHNALWSGYSVQEAVYQQTSTHIGLQWIGEKPMQWFEPKNDGRLILRTDGSGVEREVDQRFKFFLTRRNAAYENPYGKALLSMLYWPHFFKTNGFKFWAKFLERFGTPILLGKCEDSETEDMSTALLNAHSQSVISIDAKDDVEILSNGSGNAGASFEIFDKVLTQRIQRVILGQTLTSGTDGTGSRALGEVHENVRKDKLKSDIRLITPTVQAIINALCDLNQWQRHKIVIGEDPKSLNKEQADRDSVLARDLGVKFSPDYVSKAYGFEEGDIVQVSEDPQPKQFTALPHQAFSFKAQSQKLPPEQLEVDELTDAQDLSLLDPKQVKQLVFSSENPSDLAFNLARLIPDATKSQFAANLDQALYAADVLGYVTAQGGK